MTRTKLLAVAPVVLYNWLAKNITGLVIKKDQSSVHVEDVKLRILPTLDGYV